ncbi:MAG: sulfatase-like hydrolase/transferase [Luteitalea sp.]|nr:sulfatase-like hydrolase/transferase [Luteitalea sp.]
MARLMAAACLLVAIAAPPALAQQAARPNILWITSEDNGPNLGAYGDTYATTPNLDRLASRGLRYLNAWSTAPVCAPARTAIITGMYPSSTGSEHMRSMVRLPASMRMFPELLRQAGYYTSNNVKEDYNIEKTGKVWDDSSKTAHWRNRPQGKPFFAVFNITLTHESQIRSRPHTWVHDPAKAPLPAYHPDTREVREDWAQYHDKMTEMDRVVGERLAELEADGLADDTIVIYFGDHGAGLPRLKRWPYNSGLRVPLLAYVPPKFRHLAPDGYEAGGTSTRLVGFVDLAPTMLSVVGLEVPAWMQGHAFFGRLDQPAPAFAFGVRGRMDERYDMVRSVRDQRYIYIRNYLPHRIYGQYLSYMFETPTTQVWKRLYDEGKLEPPRTFFWETKPPEELYDLTADPDEVHNLAASSTHRTVLERLRRALDGHAATIRDVGFLPEYEMRRRAASSTPYEMGHDERRYDLDRVRTMAMQASDARVPLDVIRQGLTDADPAVRYWAAMGMLIREGDAVSAAADELTDLLEDEAPGPRIMAAEVLARYGSEVSQRRAIDVLVETADVTRSGFYESVLALNSLCHVEALPAEVKETVEKLPTTHPSIHQRENFYLQRLVEAIVDGKG